ncbi:MAG: hypothetical protein ACR2GZ_04575 [Solirubrobacteraceae bacterium]
MRGKLLRVVAGLAGCVCVAGSAVAATPLVIHNPRRDGLTGRPFSGPDPSVIATHRGLWRYFLVCTSDNARDAFPIWISGDLVAVPGPASAPWCDKRLRSG